MLVQHVVFEGALSLLMEILGIDLSGKQIQRVSEWYGTELYAIIDAHHNYYHAVEKIENLARLHFRNQEHKKNRPFDITPYMNIV